MTSHDGPTPTTEEERLIAELGLPKFSREELDMMKSCGREAFWQRCVPLCAGITVGMHMSRSRGLIKPTYYGFKLGAAIFMGYTLGKVSYVPVCRDRLLLQFPNGSYANFMKGKTNEQGLAHTVGMVVLIFHIGFND